MMKAKRGSNERCHAGGSPTMTDALSGRTEGGGLCGTWEGRLHVRRNLAISRTFDKADGGSFNIGILAGSKQRGRPLGCISRGMTQTTNYGVDSIFITQGIGQSLDDQRCRAISGKLIAIAGRSHCSPAVSCQVDGADDDGVHLPRPQCPNGDFESLDS